MIKKISVTLLSMTLFLGISAFAQTGTEPINTTVAQPEPSKQIQAFNGLRARHCDDGLESEKLTIESSLTLDAAEEKTLCNVFINESEFPVTVKYSYVHAEVGDAGTPACDIAGGKFGTMITTPEPTTFTIPAKSNIVRYDKMFLPVGMSGGVVRGCLGYGVVSLEPNPGEKLPMFKIENRKVILYKVLVGGKSSIINKVSLAPQKSDIFITNNKIKGTYTTGGLLLSATFKNEGNIDQIVSGGGKISNFLGYQKDFSFGETKVGPYQTVELSTNVGETPSYKGLFTVSMNITNKTSFDFDTSDIPAELLKGGSFAETGTMFIFSWIFVGAIIMILFVVWTIIKGIIPKKKQPITQVQV